MAIANFFNRAVQAVGQALPLVDRETLAQKLNDFIIAIVFDEASLAKPNTNSMLSLAVNLASRFYPRISIVYDGFSDKGQALKQELETMALSINPSIELVPVGHHVFAAICVGEPNLQAKHKVYVNAGSWNIEVNVGRPASTITQTGYNPFSATATVCFGMDEIFRAVFNDEISPDSAPANYCLSLLDYSQNLAHETNLPVVNLKDVSLVGLGAVGSGLVWCLAKLEGLTGHITLIDHETVELSNLQRYILTNQQSVQRHKTIIAEEYLRREGLEISFYPENRFGEYVSEYRPNCMFDVIAVSVDNAACRFAVQSVLPRVVLNAWTAENGLLGVSRHWFDSNQACLACLYLSTTQQKSQLEQLVEITGFEPTRIIELITNQVCLDNQALQEIASNKNYPFDVVASFEGNTINEFYTKAVCGGVLINFIDQVIEPEAIVPLAHQSVLSGALLAAEIVKESLGLLNKEQPVETRIEVLKRPKEYLNFRRNKTQNPKCICQDSDYLFAYSQKHNL
ncbi:MAG: hypothetical protein VR67_05515 [Peptococcaceae bacterium BRH_c8a]|nr:MAG: hypothetical protein VR67_05515 [Peptococcaceae bacterium BRH_c8a]